MAQNIIYNPCVYACMLSQSCLTICDSMDSSPPGSSIHGLLQARVLEWVAISSSRGPSPPRDWTQVSHIAGRFFTVWATKEALLFLLICKRLYHRTQRVCILNSSTASCLIISSSCSNHNFSPLGTSELDVCMQTLIWRCSGIQGGRGYMQSHMPAGRLRASGEVMALMPFKLFCLPPLVSWYMQTSLPHDAILYPFNQQKWRSI